MTSEELANVYRYIYDNNLRKASGLYASHSVRDHHFIDFIKNNVSKNATILDASCGRGHLMRSLLKEGYKVKGTEIASSLFKNSLKGLDVSIMTYEELKSLGENSFDVVISNDVLEHLLDENALKDALKNLCYLSKKWLLTSIGMVKSTGYPERFNLAIPDLHTIVYPAEWWIDLLLKYTNKKYCVEDRSLFYFGTTRESVANEIQ